MDKLGFKRIPTCIAVFVGCIILGIPSSLGNGIWADIKLLGMDFLTFFDFISNSIIMPIVAFLTAIFVGYIIKPNVLIEEVELNGLSFKKKKVFVVIIKYIAPVCILLILLTSILSAFGLFTI